MAHFAEIDENNVVLRVVPVPNSILNDGDNPNIENENLGIEYLKSQYGENTNWLQTSYNGRIREVYAGIGCTYCPVKNRFYPIKPYDSWIFNPQRNEWECPVKYPSENPREIWNWNESILDWEYGGMREPRTDL